MRELRYLHKLLGEFKQQVHKIPTPLGQDNQSTLTLCNSTHFNARTKHISLRYHHCGDQLRAGVVQLRYLPTESMTADILTKPLPQAAHKTHTAVLLGHQRLRWPAAPTEAACSVVDYTHSGVRINSVTLEGG